MGPLYFKYGVTLDNSTKGSTAIAFVPYKAGLNTFATSSDWTPAAADFQVRKKVSGSAWGAPANIATTPTWVNGSVVIILTGTELTAEGVTVRIENAAINSDEIIAFTFGNPSAMYPLDFVDGVRQGMTALPNAAAGASGGVYVIGGTGVTVGGYASGQSPATLVLAGTMTDYTEVGTVGYYIYTGRNAADAMNTNGVQLSPSAQSSLVTAINETGVNVTEVNGSDVTLLSTLAGAKVYTTARVASGSLTIWQGETWSHTEGTHETIIKQADDTWPSDLSGYTVTSTITKTLANTNSGSLSTLAMPCTVTQATGDQSFYIEAGTNTA
jgi:hypothetical protein